MTLRERLCSLQCSYVEPPAHRSNAVSVSSKPTCRVVRPRDTYAGKQGFSVTDVLPPRCSRRPNL